MPGVRRGSEVNEERPDETLTRTLQEIWPPQ